MNQIGGGIQLVDGLLTTNVIGGRSLTLDVVVAIGNSHILYTIATHSKAYRRHRRGG